MKIIKTSIIGIGLLLFCINSVWSQKKQSNVLFIIADDLNTNVGVYGHYLVKTPNIDRLAREGLLFRNAYSNFPVCGPSRASLMTGLYPSQSNLKALRTLVRERLPDVTTMSQNFMNNGYVAARIGKIYHYDNPNGIGTPGHDDPSSWQHTINPIGRDKDEEDKIYSLKPKQFGATLSWLAADGKDEEQTDGIVATETIKLLNQYAKDNKPFFLGVGFYKPHTPFVAPKKYFDMYPKDKIKIPEVSREYLSTLPVPTQEVLTRFKEQNNLSKEHALSAIQAYYACISFLDAQVGRILDALEKNGLKENTIVVFTSDHGYHMGEHGYYQKKTLFENAAQVPLIISYPGQSSKGKETNSFVELIDFYPTFSELAGITFPSFVAGKSMLPILRNPTLKIRESALTEIENGYTLRTENYRYTRWLADGNNMVELYDRKKDPAEMNNLARDSKYKNKIQKLENELAERVKVASEKPAGLTYLQGKEGKP